MAAIWRQDIRDAGSRLHFSVRAAPGVSGGDFDSIPRDQLHTCFTTALQAILARTPLAGFTLAPEGIVVPPVTRNSQGAALYSISLPCPAEVAPHLRRIIVGLGGSISMEMGRAAPVHAMLCAEGARDANDALCLLRIDTSMDANLSARVLHAALKSIIPRLSWVARVIRTAGMTTIDASYPPEAELCPSALRHFIPGHGSEFVALAGGSHAVISDGALGFTISADATGVTSATIHLRRALQWVPQRSAAAPPAGAGAPPAGRGARSAWGSLHAPTVITEATGSIAIAAAQATAAILGLNPPPTAPSAATAPGGAAASGVSGASPTPAEAAVADAAGFSTVQRRRKEQKPSTGPHGTEAALAQALAAGQASAAEQAAIRGQLSDKRRNDAAADKVAADTRLQAERDAAEQAAAAAAAAAAALLAAEHEAAGVDMAADTEVDAEVDTLVEEMVASAMAAAPPEPQMAEEAPSNAQLPPLRPSQVAGHMAGSKRPTAPRDRSPDRRVAAICKGASEAMEGVVVGVAAADDVDMVAPTHQSPSPSATPLPPPPPHGTVGPSPPHA
jgi:hypothetical protein